MSKRLPNGYFRQTVSKSSDVRAAPPEGASSILSSDRSRRPQRVSLWLVAASCVAAALVGVVGTRLMMQQGAENPSPTPTPPASNTLDLTFYDGAAIPVSASHAAGKCSQSREDRADMFLDNRANTVWRCPGVGVREMVSFTSWPGTELVGVQITNSDTTDQGHQAGHRILAVCWTFSDGSWAVQPLGVSRPGNQEMRFPPVVTDDVLMTVLSTMEPGSPEITTNTAAASRVEFPGRS